MWLSTLQLNLSTLEFLQTSKAIRYLILHRQYLIALRSAQTACRSQINFQNWTCLNEKNCSTIPPSMSLNFTEVQNSHTQPPAWAIFKGSYTCFHNLPRLQNEVHRKKCLLPLRQRYTPHDVANQEHRQLVTYCCKVLQWSAKWMQTPPHNGQCPSDCNAWPWLQAIVLPTKAHQTDNNDG